LHPNLQIAYEKLEHQRKQIVESIKNLPEDIYKTAPDGKWSIAQILMHLLTAERLSIAYMKKKSLGIDGLKNSGIKQKLVAVLLKISQRGPFRFTAPKVIVENTPEALTCDELIARWEKSRADLKQFLESIPVNHTRKLIYKHPLVGMLDATQGINFMYEHIHHHLPQIKRLLNQ